MARQQQKKKAGPSDQARADAFELEKLKLTNIKYGIIGFFGVLGLLALWPSVTALSGERTIVDVNLVLTATVGLGFALSVTIVAHVRQRRRADKLQGRNERLDGKVEVLEGEKRALGNRVDGLIVDLGRLRRENERLHAQLGTPRADDPGTTEPDKGTA